MFAFYEVIVVGGNYHGCGEITAFVEKSALFLCFIV